MAKITRDSRGRRVFHASPVREALAASGLDLSDITEEEIEKLEEEWEAKHGRENRGDDRVAGSH